MRWERQKVIDTVHFLFADGRQNERTLQRGRGRGVTGGRQLIFAAEDDRGPPHSLEPGPQRCLQFWL